MLAQRIMQQSARRGTDILFSSERAEYTMANDSTVLAKQSALPRSILPASIAATTSHLQVR